MRNVRNSLLLVIAVAIKHVFTEESSVATARAFGVALIAFLIFAVWKALDDDEEIAAEARARGVPHFYFKDQIKIMAVILLFTRGPYWIGLLALTFYLYATGQLGRVFS